MDALSSQKRLIINADDFGFSEGITEGILLAHRKGILTSTTLTANMPAAEAAVGRLAEVPELGVGVHLNASQGPPLSEDGRQSLAGDDGQMNRTATGVILASLRPAVLRAILAEFDSQIRWMLDHGLRPTHLDSHRHAHGFPPIFRGVLRLAKRYNIPFVRRLGERLPGDGWPLSAAKQRRVRWLLNRFAAFNRRHGEAFYATDGTWGVAHTGRLDTLWWLRAAAAMPPGVTEVMTHPGLPDGLDETATRLTTARRVELDALCDPVVRAALQEHGVTRIHYGQLRTS